MEDFRKLVVNLMFRYPLNQVPLAFKKQMCCLKI